MEPDMPATATAEVLDREDTDIVTFVEADATPFILDTNAFDGLVEMVRADMASFTPDLTTKAGRDEIASRAYKIARCKTTIDAAGKALNEDAQAKIKTINAARNHCKAKLESLQVEVRAPLTKWEVAEKARAAEAGEVLDWVRGITENGSPAEATVAHVTSRIEAVSAKDLSEALFRDDLDLAEMLRGKALVRLQADIERIKTAEAEREELARLRAEATQRAAKDEAERLERERAEQDRQRQEAAQRLADEAAARAVRDAEEKHQRELAEAERRHLDDIARAKRESDHEAALAENERRKEVERLAEIDAANERRATNARHRKSVVAKAVKALAEAGIAETVADIAIDAIAEGKIPGVSIQF